jgi:hypothetical protein
MLWAEMSQFGVLAERIRPNFFLVQGVAFDDNGT